MTQEVDHEYWDVTTWEDEGGPSPQQEDEKEPTPVIEQEIIITWREGLPWDDDTKRVSD